MLTNVRQLQELVVIVVMGIEIDMVNYPEFISNPLQLYEKASASMASSMEKGLFNQNLVIASLRFGSTNLLNVTLASYQLSAAQVIIGESSSSEATESLSSESSISQAIVIIVSISGVVIFLGILLVLFYRKQYTIAPTSNSVDKPQHMDESREWVKSERNHDSDNSNKVRTHRNPSIDLDLEELSDVSFQ